MFIRKHSLSTFSIRQRFQLGFLVCSLSLGLGGVIIPAPSWAVTPPKLLAQDVEAVGASENEPLEKGRQLYASGLFAEAVTAFQAAAKIYAERNDAANRALSLNYSSLALQELSQWSAADQAITESLELLESSNVSETILWAHALNTQASLQLATGKAEDAIATWDKAHQFYKQAGDRQGAIGSQVNQAQAWQRLGFYRRASDLLMTLTQQLDGQPDSPIKQQSLHSLGVAYQQLGDFAASREVLEQSLAITSPPSRSAILLSLGNTEKSLGQPQKALRYAQQAEQAAIHPQDQVDARLNQLRFHLDLDQQQQAIQLASDLYHPLAQLPTSRHTVYQIVNFVNSTLEWDVGQSPVVPEDLHQLLTQAMTMARQLQDEQAAAYTAIQQGQLYDHYSQIQRAITSTQQALSQAQSVRATDITALAASQLGRLYSQEGDRNAAVIAYRQAVQAFQAIRGDLAAINSEVQFSFRDSVEPTYRQLVALLLDSDQPSREDLIEARTLVEALQLAELDNFFREACADLQPVSIDQVDPTAAVVYSIILPERTAILISRPQQPPQYYVVPHSQSEVKARLDGFLESLSLAYDNAERLLRSQQLYDWLIRPAEQDQAFAGVETLVFVLDGALRNIPVSALHDGEQYLIEKYRIALSPGLQLLAPRPLKETKLSAITGGLSQAHQGFSELPGVESELKQLTQNLPATVLLNQDFTQTKLATEIAEQPASIVHLATHGQFSSDAANTFLLTWEGRLNVKEFSDLLDRQNTRNSENIELLVLSACQTAVGDDRAVLGLAGFAVRSGARATLATLWSVRDQSTALLMRKFYQYLRRPGITKAEALRQAQLSLLADSDYDDPFFWAPFVLVGNWL